MMVHFGNPTGVWTDGQWWYFRRVEKGTSRYSAVTVGGGGSKWRERSADRWLQRGAGAAVSFSKRFPQDPRGSTEPLAYLSMGQGGAQTAEGLSPFLCFSSLLPNATSHRISNYVYQIF